MSSTVEKFENFPFGELLRQIGLGVADAQLALDLNGVQSAQLLADTKFQPGEVLIAIIETVDAAGNITNVEFKTNESELSLLAWGLNPTFIQFSETTVEIRYVAYMRKSEYNYERQSEYHSHLERSYRTSKTKWGAGGGFSLNLGIFKIGGGGGYQSATKEGRYSSDLIVSSSTSVAIANKVEGDWGQCKVNAILRPKDPPARLVPQVIQKTEPVPIP